MNFYTAFFWALLGFVVGMVVGWAGLLFIMREAMKAGKLKFKNKDGSWTGDDERG